MSAPNRCTCCGWLLCWWPGKADGPNGQNEGLGLGENMDGTSSLLSDDEPLDDCGAGAESSSGIDGLIMGTRKIRLIAMCPICWSSSLLLLLLLLSDDCDSGCIGIGLANSIG